MKSIIISVFLFIIYSIPLKAQLVSTTFEGNWVYIPQNPIDFKKPFLFKAGLENWFSKRIALGINGQAGMASIEKEDYVADNGQIISEKDLEISNTIYSLNAYNKIAILVGDDCVISLKSEVGIYWAASMPTITFIDRTTSNIDIKEYPRTNKNSFCFGLGIHCQYFITPRWDACLSVGYNSYNIGNSLNKIDLESDWSSDFKEKTCFISAGIGIHYYLFGWSRR